MTGLLASWRELRRFQRTPRSHRGIVFFSEGAHHWPHLGPVAMELVLGQGQTLCYVASTPNDPALDVREPGFHSFLIGEGTVRTIWFRSLEADLMVSSLPDLQSFHLTRSAYPVHYVYLHHSIASTHMAYRETAFDHFDTVLCVGPHHRDEIRAAECARNLPRKRLAPHGYARLDALLEVAQPARAPGAAGGAPRVLVAPSWGDSCILESLGETLTAILLAGDCDVTLRPHPMTSKRHPHLVRDLAAKFGSHPRFRVDIDMVSLESLRSSDIMISDWSGAALEFALGLEKPVIFIDVPPKMRNPNYHMLGIEPIEHHIRGEVGLVVSPSGLATVPDATRSLLGNSVAVDRIRAARHRWVYNVGTSSIVAAETLRAIVQGQDVQEC